MKLKLLLELKEREPMLNGDGTAFPPIIVKEIQRNIRKGAKDLDQNWKNAVHLCRKAFDVCGVEVPLMNTGDAWIQYEHLVSVAVRELHKARGSTGKYSDWRKNELRKDDSLIPIHMRPLDTLPAQERYLNNEDN